MRTLFEGGPIDGGYLDVDGDDEYVKTFSPVEALRVYDPVGPVESEELRIYTYKRWEVRYPGDGRVEIRYCLVGRKPRV